MTYVVPLIDSSRLTRLNRGILAEMFLKKKVCAEVEPLNWYRSYRYSIDCQYWRQTKLIEMPTATGYFGYSALNLGPLTTTFTAPSSCATKADHQIYANATSPYLPFVTASSCTGKGYGDCYPSGEKWDTEARQTTKFVQGAYPYFSPGVACPKGWETVGMLQHGSSSGQFGVSGVLTVSTSRMYEDVDSPEFLQPTDFWKNVLDRDETMAVCCPT